jgi:hypothetical protein
MAKLRAIWRIARQGTLGLAVAVVFGLAAHAAEARDDWRWDGYTHVWVETSYYPPAYYYPPLPVADAPAYCAPYIGFIFRIH